MSSHIEHEVNSCMVEMEQLQEKMRVLNETKQKQEAMNETEMEQLQEKMRILNKTKQDEKLAHLLSTTSCMMMLDNVMNKYKESEVFDKEANEAMKALVEIRKVRGRIAGDLTPPPLPRAEQQEFLKYHECPAESVRLYGSHMPGGRVPSQPLDLAGAGLFTHHRPVPMDITDYMIQKPTGLAHNPTIKDFVEATHGLFQLQEKRIDELEAKQQSHHYTMHPVHRECEEQQI